MTRKLWLFPLVLVLLAAACAPPTSPNLPITTSQHWFASTVDAYLNAGLSASLALDSDGAPHLAYLSLNQTLPKGVIAPARPVTLPLIPAIMTADLTKDGVWEHGDVVATKEVTKPLSLKPTDQVALTIDGQGDQDVAFTESGELQFSQGPKGGAFSSTPDQVSQVGGGVVGLSIATASDGTPWISWLDGSQVLAATKSGKKWITQQVATLASPAEAPNRTWLVATGKGAAIAYGDPSGQGPMYATIRVSGGRKTLGVATTAVTIDPGAGGYGISLANANGNPMAAYYTKDGEVRLATSNGGNWTTTSVAQTGSGPDAGWSASVASGGKGPQYVAWYDAKRNETHLGSVSGGSVKELQAPGTVNGERPVASVSPDGSQVYVAYYDKVNLDLLLGDYVVSGTPQLTLAGVPSIGAPPTGAPPAQCSPSGSTVDVVAQGIAFAQNCYAAPAGQAFTISFDNKDSAVPHNFDVLTAAGGTHLFGATATQLTTGPGSATYKVSAQKPGTYYFQCDVHPTQMFGTFVVK